MTTMCLCWSGHSWVETVALVAYELMTSGICNTREPAKCNVTRIKQPISASTPPILQRFNSSKIEEEVMLELILPNFSGKWVLLHNLIVLL